MTRRSQVRGALTRAKLIDAALATLHDDGYAACSLPRLCQRAGVSRGAQQHHFPTKAELLAAAVEQLMTERHEELRDGLKTEAQPSVRDFVKRLWKIYSGKSFHTWAELAMAARTDPELREHLVRVNDRFYEEARRTMAGILRVDPADPAALVAARFVTSMMDGVAMNRLLDDDDRMTFMTLELFEQSLEHLLGERR